MKQPPMSPEDARKVLDSFDVTEELPFSWGKVWCPVNVMNKESEYVDVVARPMRIFRCEAILIAQPGPDCWLQSFQVGQETPWAAAGGLPGELFDAGNGRTLADIVASDPGEYEHALPTKARTAGPGDLITLRICGAFKGVALWGTSFYMPWRSE